MLKNIINTIHQIFNVVSKNLKSIGFKAGRLRFNRLKIIMSIVLRTNKSLNCNKKNM